MKKIILKNGSIYDGTLNMVLQENTDIEIIDGKISRIDKGIDDKEAKVIDLSGKYVVPGLINLHAHLPSSGKMSKKQYGDKTKLVNFVRNNPIGKKIGVMLCKKSAIDALKSGVTTIRTVGGVSNLDSILRDKINSGKLLGPRLIVANEAIGVVGGHMDGTVARPVKNEEEAIQMVRDLHSKNTDIVKLMITGGVLDGKTPGHPGTLKMPKEIVKAVCDEAHLLGLKVAAHVEGKEGMEVAIKYGVDSIEHGSTFDEKYKNIIKERNVCLVATLTPAIPFLVIDPNLLYGDVAKINSQIVLDGIIEAANKFRNMGALVGLGTDAGSILSMHYDFVNELLSYVKYCGVSNSYALHTATEINSMIAGISNETGTISVGKYADLLIVNDDPIKDLHTLKKPELVFIKGRRVKDLKIKKDKVAEQLLANIY